MTLDDLKAGGGCPRCVGGEAGFFWSGGDLAVAEVLAGGADSLDARFDEGGWPVSERARCRACGAVWDFEFRWHDRPPLLLLGAVTDAEAPPPP